MKKQAQIRVYDLITWTDVMAWFALNKNNELKTC